MQKPQKMHGTIFMQHLRKSMLTTNIITSKALNLKMKEAISMQAHIDKLWMIANQLTNIYHQVFYEDLTFTLLENLPSSFHTFVV